MGVRIPPGAHAFSYNRVKRVYPHTNYAFVMFCVYVLKSSKDLKLYIGSTSDLKRRVEEHNKGLVGSTKARRPLKLVYYEAYSSEEDARNREKQLKLRGQARRHLVNRIKNSIGEQKHS